MIDATASMCQVMFINYRRHQQNGQKRASLLIQLQEGLRLESGPGGMLWIVCDEDYKEDDDKTDGEEYTQECTESGETAPTAVSDKEN